MAVAPTCCAVPASWNCVWVFYCKAFYAYRPYSRTCGIIYCGIWIFSVVYNPLLQMRDVEPKTRPVCTLFNASAIAAGASESRCHTGKACLVISCSYAVWL